MPTPRNLLRGRRGWTDVHRRQLSTGWNPFSHQGWSDGLGLLHPSHREYSSLASVPADVLQDMLAAWSAMGDEIMAAQREKHPGKRPWFVWITSLLVDEPLRIVDAEYFDEDNNWHMRMPSGRVWEDEHGVESSFSYLLRRGLLQPGELDRIRAHESSDALGARTAIERNRTAYHRIPLSGHTLACIGFILGADVLTADERDEAAGELALLRSYEEAP